MRVVLSKFDILKTSPHENTLLKMVIQFQFFIYIYIYMYIYLVGKVVFTSHQLY